MIRFFAPAALLLALLVVAPDRASADCTSGLLAPGSTVCVSAPSQFSSSATVTASSDVLVKWDVWLTINPATTLVHEEKTLGFTTQFSAGTGWYTACATRPSNHTTGANFSLCVDNP
jgi:hypothetical protein